MARQHPGKESERRTAALVKAVNAALEAHYGANRTDAKKRISISLSDGRAGSARSPEEQAAYLLKGASWTANSAHMADGAKQILVHQGGTVPRTLTSLKARDEAAFNVMVKTWKSVMKTQDLRDHGRGSRFDYPGSHPLHLRLPTAKLNDNDPRVIRTLEIYAKATRLEGQAKNVLYETKRGSAFQKKWLRQYDQDLLEQNAAKKNVRPR
jgi:hypothetical protein